jgi:nucleoside-diphosphate-sugar epimerase
MHSTDLLITGGDGYLGARLARHALATTDDRLLLWLHATQPEAFAAKQQRLLAWLDFPEERVQCAWGDITADDPFQGVEPQAIRRIIHTAAATRFNVDVETARQVNIAGTRNVLELAERCSQLERVVLLSTVYTSGLTAGTIPEVAFDGKDGFANYYEWSKWESERLVMTEFAHLPWQIIRIATVIADDPSGTVRQQNAFHNTLKLFYYGLLALLPGARDTPLYFITGEFATNAVLEMLQHGAARTIYHVAHRQEESLALEPLIDLVYDVFSQDRGFATRRVLKPLFSDQETFSLLADGVSAFASSVVSQAVASVAPFSRQLFVNKRVLNDRAVALLPDYAAPDPAALIRRTCEMLVAERWQRGDHLAVP